MNIVKKNNVIPHCLKSYSHLSYIVVNNEYRSIVKIYNLFFWSSKVFLLFILYNNLIDVIP